MSDDRIERDDAEARTRIREDLESTLLVEAAAGTGKTTELIGRIVSLLATGRTEIDRVVAVTFTEKAAGELRLRLRGELDVASRKADGAERTRLLAAVAHLEEGRISTIHGFCADLLREEPAAARVDPRFETLDDAASSRLLAGCFRAWLARKLEDPPEGLRRALCRKHRHQAPTPKLAAALASLAEWPDFDAPWTRPATRPGARAGALIAELQSFVELRRSLPTGTNYFRDTRVAEDHAEAIARMDRQGRRDPDLVEALLVDLARQFGFRKGPPASLRGRPGNAAVVAAHERLLADLGAFAGEADADLAALLSRELREPLAAFHESKQRAGRVSFVDLLLLVRNMLRDRDDVRARLQARFTHILVDELQDTDPLQAEILLLLSARDPACRDGRAAAPAPGKLFLVGDPKQAIYRFRRADVAVYHELKAQLRGSGAELLHLTKSFRSVPQIQAFVNAAFAPRMEGGPQSDQASYVPLSPHRPPVEGRPSIVALPVPRPLTDHGITKRAIERSIPVAIAAFVSWLLKESGLRVTEREGVEVDVAPRHIAILFRRFESWGEDVTRPYLEALDAREIPHILVGGKSFHAREEVETLTAALRAIEDPDDELAVFATLKGSLFAIDDETLLLHRHRNRHLHPLRISEGEEGDLAEVADALRILAKLHRGRSYCSVTTTLDRLLGQTRALGAFAFRPNGERVLANVLHLSQKAREYEASGGLSLQGFLARLAHEQEAAASPEGPLHEDGGEGVRVMTVHKAKGLEFPVVVLADLTAKLSHAQADRHIDRDRKLCALRIADCTPLDLALHEEEEIARDRAEGVRVAYVAATRARDLLVVPALGVKPWDGWLAPLNDALYPEGSAWDRATPAPGCPSFGKSSVLSDPDSPEVAARTVRPGLHSLPGYDVVWWDPACLDLDVRASFGVRQRQLLEPRADAATVGADRAAYDRWMLARQSTLDAGHQWAHAVMTARQRATSPFAVFVSEPQIVLVPRVAGRPQGARFGSLVHGTLERIDLPASPDHVARTALLVARLLGATKEETEAAIAAVVAALSHDLLQRAVRASLSGNCRREVPLTLTEGSLIVEGVVDLAFLEDDCWLVVDYKTDLGSVIDARSPVLDFYRAQVRVYAAAIAAATGDRAVPILLGA